MSELRIKFIFIYLIALISAYLLKRLTYRIANKAIEEKKLSTGIYKYFPLEGERAVELAEGYIKGINIYFWFIVIFFPFIFIIGLMQNAI